MNILAIGAHPDDIEFGCGGTLVKYSGKGARIDLLVMTDGGRGGRPRQRRLEQREAAHVLGARRIHWGGYADTLLPAIQRLIDRIEQVIRTLRPDFIFVNYPEDTHQDHRQVARRPPRQGAGWERIGSEIERKLKALRMHKSQVMRTRIEATPIFEIAEASAHFRGVQGRVRWAEGFAPLRLFINVSREREASKRGSGPGRAR